MTSSTDHITSFKALATLLLGLFFLMASQAQEKKKIVIKHADQQEGRKINGNDIAWLVGNVVYEHEGAIMKCDSSIYYRSENRFDAFGNVRINQGDSLSLKGDQMSYKGASRLLHLSGNVFMTDGEMQLRCDDIIYDRNLNLAYYNSGGVLNQGENMLSSKMGFYNASSKRFTFKDSVRLFNPKYRISADTLQYGSANKVAYFIGPTEIISDSTYIYCEKGQYDTQNDIAQLTVNALIKKKAQTIKGDSIYYKVATGFGDITGNAYISDTVNKYVITGGRAIYRQSPEFALVYNQPLYALDFEQDTLYITGDTLRVTSTLLEGRKLRVYENARFFKRDFQGKSDSLTYTDADSTFHLYNEPVIWNQNNQLTADFIFMTTKKGNLDSLHMMGNAFLVALEDTNKYNQIKGRNMYGTFFENELRTIYVSGNGQTLYYAYDENEKEVGINRADCSDIKIKILLSKVEMVTFLKKPNATLYPPGMIPLGELFLKGFRPRFKEQFKSKEDLFK